MPVLINPFSKVSDIPVPDDYKRVPAASGSFASWLRKLPLKQSRTVYLYNGMPKRNQTAQYCVLDIPTGREDLQQCADAVMRLRAEYLFEQERWNELVFRDNAHKAYCYRGGRQRSGFETYLRTVFAYCGTASLEKQLQPLRSLAAIQPGDVFIKGGFPGHAAIVVDVAINARGEKIFLLAQGFMPAQDMHILKNPGDSGLSPWYKAVENQPVITPEWTFSPRELRRW
ncbi:MAG TPA: DUF4846 domain-containing protein [Chitinophagaceae bacterium]|nr:DUF4846 domain-containing protein [Chitinophagaceae bacterium]